MTSGGFTKQRACFWAAVTFFIVAILCAIESMTGGDPVYRGLALVGFMFGGISVAGYGVQTFIARSEASDTED